MIKLKSLLPETADPNQRITSLDGDIKEFIETNCKEAIAAVKRGFEIYRADPGFYDVASLVKASTSPRSSANGSSNHYMVYVDESPYWKEYPRRSYSAICGGYGEAIAYGEPYLILFLGNPKLGRVTCGDFWCTKTIGGNGLLLDFIDELGDLFDAVGNTDINSWNRDPAIYNVKLEELRALYDKHQLPPKINGRRRVFLDYLIGCGAHKHEDFYKAFYGYFTPTTAGAKVANLSQLSGSTKGMEIWGEGSFVAIDRDVFWKLIGASTDRVTADEFD